MARGNSTRRNLAPEDISKLIRGDKTALQGQASKGGNAAPVQPTAPATPAAPTPATPVAPNPAVPTTQAFTPAEVAELQAQLAADSAKEQQLKDYFQNLQQKGEFDSEQAAEAAREAAFKSFIEGKRSMAEAAAIASPKNAKKNAKKGKGEEGEEGKGKKETPWYLRSGRGFAGLFFGRGGKGGINDISVMSEGAAAQQEELINNLRKKVGVRGAPAPVVAPPPSK